MREVKKVYGLATPHLTVGAIKFHSKEIKYDSCSRLLN